jgi:tetratricopeptide (TPR) repeat protein
MTAYAGIDDYIEALDYYYSGQKSVEKVLLANPLYLFTAGKILFNNQHFKESLQILQRYVNKFPIDSNYFSGITFLSKSYERIKNYTLSAVYLIQALDKTPPESIRYELMLILGRVLTRLTPDKRETLSPTYRNPKVVLATVKNNSKKYEETREATILLNDELLKEKDFEKVIDNYYKFLLEKRDKVVVTLFKKNLNRYIQYLQNNNEYELLFQLWVNLKNRKSFLSDKILVQLADNLYQAKLFLNADGIYMHILAYNLYKKYWNTARLQHSRILFKIGHYDEFLTYIKDFNHQFSTKDFEFEYLQALSIIRTHPEKLPDFLKNLQLKNIRNTFTYSLKLIKAQNLKNMQKYEKSLEVLQELSKNTFREISEAQKATCLIYSADIHYILKKYRKALKLYTSAVKHKFGLDWIFYRQIKCSEILGLESKDIQNKLKEKFPNSFWTGELKIK